VETEQGRLLSHLVQFVTRPYWTILGPLSLLDHAWLSRSPVTVVSKSPSFDDAFGTTSDSSHVHSFASFSTDIHYNPKRPINKLDIYIPREPAQSIEYSSGRDGQQVREERKPLRPVIVFIYGGGWYSGSKFIYTLIGACLRSMGYLVILPDYSIYPQGKCKEMEQDVKMAIQWAYRHCMEYGGDPQKIYLMGHSAGAHLCALAVLNDSIRRTPVSLYGPSPAAISASPILTALLSEPVSDNQEEEDVLPRLRGMMLFSGVYDIPEHYRHESTRGVEQISAMGRVMDNSQATFRQHSPTFILQELLEVSTRIDKNYPTESQTRHQNLLRHLRSLLPIEMLMVHGTRDRIVPAKSSLDLYMELETLQLGPSAKLRIVKGMGHEEPSVGKNRGFPSMDIKTVANDH
jgi:acetyl esterase/lipase